MPTGAITDHIDVAQLTLVAFFLFFIGLVLYLRREDKREGYPLESQNPADRGRVVEGFPWTPPAKVFNLPHVGDRVVPRTERDLTGLAIPAGHFEGAPLIPTGNPMRDGIGPASWADRKDEPDLTFDETLPKIVPLRAAAGYYLSHEDPDPRGMEVLGADRRVAGTVSDVWIDRSETFVRYLEIALTGLAEVRHVLVPMSLATIDARRRLVRVKSLYATQFADIPGTKSPEQITLLEEDKISAYCASGHLYAVPGRLGPVL